MIRVQYSQVSQSSTLIMQLGLMRLTWNPNPVPYDQAFDAIKAAVDAMPAGVKLFINSGTSAMNILASKKLLLT